MQRVRREVGRDWGSVWGDGYWAWGGCRELDVGCRMWSLRLCLDMAVRGPALVLASLGHERHVPASRAWLTGTRAYM